MTFLKVCCGKSVIVEHLGYATMSTIIYKGIRQSLTDKKVTCTTGYLTLMAFFTLQSPATDYRHTHSVDRSSLLWSLRDYANSLCHPSSHYSMLGPELALNLQANTLGV